jgi:UDP-galactose transporter
MPGKGGRRSVLSKAGLLSAVALATLQCSRSLLVRASYNPEGKYSYSPEVALVLQESMKLGLAILLFLLQSPGKTPEKLANVISSTVQQLWVNKYTCLMYCVPALCYAAQNSIVFYALLYISPPMFQLFTQLKIVSTAVAFRVWQQRPLTGIQWCAIVLLLIASALGQKPSDGRGEKDGTLIGFGLSVIYCLLSTLSGTTRETLLKSETGMSMALQNCIIYSWSVVINASIAVTMNPGVFASSGMLKGFSGMVWLVVVNGALMGHVTGAVAYYADNLVSAFAAAISLFLSSGCSYVLFGTELTLLFCMGLCVSCVALYLYFGPHNALLLTNYNAEEKRTK